MKNKELLELVKTVIDQACCAFDGYLRACVTIALMSDQGPMTKERFLELATETWDKAIVAAEEAGILKEKENNGQGHPGH